MTTRLITDLPSLAVAPADADLLLIVDVDDTTDAATGTTKKITFATLLQDYITSLSTRSITELADVAVETYAQNDTLMWDATAGTFKKTTLVQSGVVSFVTSGAVTVGDIVSLDGSGNVKTTDATNYANVLGIAFNTAALGETCAVVIDGGVATGFTGLSAGSLYYVDTNGALTTSATAYKLGRALSSTTLLVNT